MKTSRKIYIIANNSEYIKGCIINKCYFTNKAKALEKAIELTKEEVKYNVIELTEAGRSI